MFTDTAPTDTYLTPQDADVPERLVTLIEGAQQRLRFIIYGCTLPAFFEAIVRAHARGVDVAGIFDHTQSCGPKEAAALHALFLQIPPQQFRIGTSETGGQIVHLKGLWVDDEMVWSGSWNFSQSATHQVNHVDITASRKRAEMFQNAFQALWAFIDRNESRYNPQLLAGSSRAA